jgi:hypothetical protein
LFGSSFSGIKVILQTCATWPFALQKEKAKPGSLLLRSYDAIVLPVLFAFVAEALPVHPPAFSPNCRKISKAVCLREAVNDLPSVNQLVHLGTWQGNNRVH